MLKKITKKNSVTIHHILVLVVLILEEANRKQHFPRFLLAFKLPREANLPMEHTKLQSSHCDLVDFLLVPIYGNSNHHGLKKPNCTLA
jgi:hypothetical protein